jgi:hypothetical protein
LDGLDHPIGIAVSVEKFTFRSAANAGGVTTGGVTTGGVVVPPVVVVLIAARIELAIA